MKKSSVWSFRVPPTARNTICTNGGSGTRRRPKTNTILPRNWPAEPPNRRGHRSPGRRGMENVPPASKSTVLSLSASASRRNPTSVSNTPTTVIPFHPIFSVRCDFRMLGRTLVSLSGFSIQRRSYRESDFIPECAQFPHRTPVVCNEWCSGLQEPEIASG